MARKKWVKKRLDPINDRLTELDQVNAKNASDIKDVDARAQAGIKKAQDSADAANQTATAADDQAKKANDTAMTATGRIDNVNTEVNGLDTYKPITDVEVPFRRGSAELSTGLRNPSLMTWPRACKVRPATSSKSKLVRLLRGQPASRAHSARQKRLSATSYLNTTFPSTVCTLWL